jgi:hypothetical protein
VSPRAYPLKAEAIHELDEGLIGVFSKGHHAGGSEIAGEPFMTTAKAYLSDVEGWDDYELDDLDGAEITFETWRCVPRKVDGDWWHMFVDAKPGRPGAFPVTVLRVD